MAGQAAFNVGRDTTLNIVVAGSPLKPTILTKFRSKQETVQLESRPLNGEPVFQEVPKGWSGEFEVDRADNALDDYFASTEDNWYAGTDTTTISILETIVNAAVGSVGASHQYRYEGVQMKFDDAGEKAGDAKIVQKVTFVASRRKKVA